MSVLERLKLNNEVAVVTGAFGKLALVWVQTLLEGGAKVAAVDLPDAEPSEALQRLRVQYGDERLFLGEADVTDRKSLEIVRSAIEHALDPVSVLVNNAGIDQPPGANLQTYEPHTFPIEGFSRVFGVNVMGAVRCMQVFGEGMARRGRGSIINIGSLYASVSPNAALYDHLPTDPPFLKPPAYGASKAALVNLTKYYAAHWGPRGVRVNALSPGGVEGGQDPEFKRKFCERVPLGRMAQLEDLAGPLLFLASSASEYVTGIELKVDGGFTVW